MRSEISHGGQTDQAEGLRRLLCAAPPEVVAVIPCGGVTTRWVAGQVQARARAGRRILAIEESMACGNQADCLGASVRFDLLQAASGEVPLERCLAEPGEGLRVAQAGRFAQSLGSERIASQRALALLERLQPGSDEWMFVTEPAGVHRVSPFALAAPRLLLVVEDHPMALTAAWSSLRTLVRHGLRARVALSQAGPFGPRGQSVLLGFCELARTQLGIGVGLVGSLGELLLPDPPAESAEAFLRRLARAACLRVMDGFEGTGVRPVVGVL